MPLKLNHPKLSHLIFLSYLRYISLYWYFITILYACNDDGGGRVLQNGKENVTHKVESTPKSWLMLIIMSANYLKYGK
jgi:hypothetical protein